MPCSVERVLNITCSTADEHRRVAAWAAARGFKYAVDEQLLLVTVRINDGSDWMLEGGAWSRDS